MRASRLEGLLPWGMSKLQVLSLSNRDVEIVSDLVNYGSLCFVKI